MSAANEEDASGGLTERRVEGEENAQEEETLLADSTDKGGG